MKGKKTGGRVKGTPNRSTIERQHQLARARKKGLLPLEYMLRVMRSRSKNVTDERRDEMAKAAAPYIHPRLNAIQHTGKDGEPIQVTLTGGDAGVL